MQSLLIMQEMSQTGDDSKFALSRPLEFLIKLIFLM